MSNDRIMLLCHCGEMKCMHKYYPGPMGSNNPLEEWIDKHLFSCHPNPHAADLEGFVPFTLHTEDIVRHAELKDGVWCLRGLR